MRGALVAHEIVDRRPVHGPNRRVGVMEIAQVGAHEVQRGPIEVGSEIPCGPALRRNRPDVDVLHAPRVSLVFICQERDLAAVGRPRGRERGAGLGREIPRLASGRGNEPEVADRRVVVGIRQPVGGSHEPFAVRRPRGRAMIPLSARERPDGSGGHVQHVHVEPRFRQEALPVLLVVEARDVHEGGRLPVLLLGFRVRGQLRGR